MRSTLQAMVSFLRHPLCAANVTFQLSGQSWDFLFLCEKKRNGFHINQVPELTHQDWWCHRVESDDTVECFGRWAGRVPKEPVVPDKSRVRDSTRISAPRRAGATSSQALHHCHSACQSRPHDIVRLAIEP